MESLGLERLQETAGFLKDHRLEVSDETLDFLLTEDGFEDVLPWLTLIVRTKNSYKYQRMGRLVSAMVGDNLTGNTILAHPGTREAHLRAVYDKVSDQHPMLLNTCVYRYSHGREATVDSLIARIRSSRSAEAPIIVVSSPRLETAEWLGRMIYDDKAEVFKPRAIVGLSETLID